jgi:hypothetical protein
MVRCPICSLEFETLQTHLVKVHRISGDNLLNLLLFAHRKVEPQILERPLDREAEEDARSQGRQRGSS